MFAQTRGNSLAEQHKTYVGIVSVALGRYWGRTDPGLVTGQHKEAFYLPGPGLPGTLKHGCEDLAGDTAVERTPTPARLGWIVAGFSCGSESTLLFSVLLVPQLLLQKPGLWEELGARRGNQAGPHGSSTEVFPPRSGAEASLIAALAR